MVPGTCSRCAAWHLMRVKNTRIVVALHALARTWRVTCENEHISLVCSVCSRLLSECTTQLSRPVTTINTNSEQHAAGFLTAADPSAR